MQRLLTTLGIAVVLVFYGEVLVHAPVAGQDLRVWFAAAAVMHGGGNPFDIHQFVRAEERLYGAASAAQRRALANNPYVEGPPLAMALLPFVGQPPSAMYRVYAAFMAAAAAAALAVLARLWPARRAAARAFVLLISPVTFLGILLGQPDALLLLALVLALWWLDQERPAAAGCVLMIGLIKPQIIAGPVILLAVLAWRRKRLGSYIAGVVAGAVVFIGISLLVAGPTVVRGWLGELIGFGGSTVYTQVDISSLTTLYVGWAPHPLSLALSVIVLLGWAGLCALLWCRGIDDGAPATRLSRGNPLVGHAGTRTGNTARPGDSGVSAGDDARINPHILSAKEGATRAHQSSSGDDTPTGSADDQSRTSGLARSRTNDTWTAERWWLVTTLTLWLLATPYSHPHDDVLLLPAVWYLLADRFANRAAYRGITLLLAILFFAAWWLLSMTSVLGLRPPVLRGLGIIPVALLTALLLLRRTNEPYSRVRQHDEHAKENI